MKVLCLQYNNLHSPMLHTAHFSLLIPHHVIPNDALSLYFIASKTKWERLRWPFEHPESVISFGTMFCMWLIFRDEPITWLRQFFKDKVEWLRKRRWRRRWGQTSLWQHCVFACQLAPICVPVLSKLILSQHSGMLAGILEYLWGALSIIQKLWSGGDITGQETLQSLGGGLRGALLTGIYPPKLYSQVSHMKPKLCCYRTGSKGFCLDSPCVIFFLFREALQVLGLLIFACKSFLRVVILKAHHRVSRLFKKQNVPADKQRKPSDPGCPQCQAEPDSHSLCLVHLQFTLLVVWHCEHMLHCCPQTLSCRTAISPSCSPSAGLDSWLFTSNWSFVFVYWIASYCLVQSMYPICQDLTGNLSRWPPIHFLLFLIQYSLQKEEWSVFLHMYQQGNSK